jgi:hypothetical protein
MAGFDAAALAKQPGKSRRAAQSMPSIGAYAEIAANFPPALDREPRATLGAARAQNLAAADAFHAGAKAVGPLAPDDRRLVGALHGLLSLEKALH